jgi:hypothetical protein
MFYYVQPRSIFLNPRFKLRLRFAKPGSRKFCDSGYNIVHHTWSRYILRYNISSRSAVRWFYRRLIYRQQDVIDLNVIYQPLCKICIICRSISFKVLFWKSPLIHINGVFLKRGEGSGNIISLHKSLWKCHPHNKGFLMWKYPFIHARDFPFICCKYLLHFICFEVNLRTSLRKIYGQINEKIPRGIEWIFLHSKTP